MLADYPKGTAYERSKQHAEELVLERARRHGDRDPEPVGGLRPDPLSHAVLRERGLRAGRPEAAPGDAPGRHRLRLRRGGRRRATCWPPTRAGTASATSWPTGTRTSASWPRRPSEIAGRGRIPPRMPVPGRARRSRRSAPGVSRVTRRPPLLPKGQLTYILWQAHPDSSKAQRELGWQTTPLDEGVRKTLDSMGLLERGLAEAADTGHEAADPRRVGAEVVAVCPDQIRLLDGAHLQLEPDRDHEHRGDRRARWARSGRSRSSRRSSPSRSGCGRRRTSRS